MEFMSEQILKAVRKSDISNRYILSYITLLIWVCRFLELYKMKKCVKMTHFFQGILTFFCFFFVLLNGEPSVQKIYDGIKNTIRLIAYLIWG